MNLTAAASPPPDPNAFFGQPVLVVAIVTLVLSTLAAGARCWSRAVILGLFALEDWLFLVGWVCAATVSACNIVQLRTGMGRVFASLSPDARIEFFKIAISVNIVYAVALLSVKVSILCLYLRALKYHYVQLATKVMLVIVAITHTWIILSLFTVIYWSHAGINIITDFLIFAIPLTVLPKLRVPRKQKAALCFVFLLAFGVCVISLARTLQFLGGMDLADRRTISMACWTMVEVNMAVICACLITMKPLISKLFPRMLSSYPEEEDQEGVETIGRARQNRRNPMESDFTTTFDGVSASLDMGNTEMVDFGAQKSRESSGVESDTVPPGRDVASSNVMPRSGTCQQL